MKKEDNRDDKAEKDVDEVPGKVQVAWLFEDDDEVHNDYNNEGENKDEDADDVPKSNDGEDEDVEEVPRKSTTCKLKISYTCW